MDIAVIKFCHYRLKYMKKANTVVISGYVHSDVLPKERLFNTHCGYIASHLMQAAPLFVPDARPLYSVPLIVSLHSLWNPLMLKMLFCMLCRRSAILVEYGARVGLFIGIQPSPSTRLGRNYLFCSQTKWVWTSCITIK